MILSSLKNFKLSELKQIAKDFNIDFEAKIKRDDLLVLLNNRLPLNFNINKYINNGGDVQSLDYDLSIASFIPIKTFDDNTKNNLQPAKLANYTDDSESISALFDVTNSEVNKFKNSITANSGLNEHIHKKRTSLGSSPSINYNDPVYKPRFGPVSSLPTTNNFITPKKPNADFENDNGKTDKNSSIIYKQAYTVNNTNRFQKDYTNQTNNYSKELFSAVLNDDVDIKILPNTTELLSPIKLNNAQGYLEINNNGYGFLRNSTFLSNESDIYVSPGIIQRHYLKNGDLVEGDISEKFNSTKHSSLLYVNKINNILVNKIKARPSFEEFTPIYPNKKIILENKNFKSSLTVRMIDFITPLGFGQRALLVSPPSSGATEILIDIANSIKSLNSNSIVIYLSVGSRPEEITYIKEKSNFELYSTCFDKTPEQQIKVAELVLERAKRLVEENKDVVIIIDNLNSVAKAIDLSTGNFSSKALTSIHYNKIKQFFSYAKNIMEGGSLTIIANLKLDANNVQDEQLHNEFKDKSNANIYLDKDLSVRYMFPAINLKKSHLRTPSLLLKEADVINFKKLKTILSTFNDREVYNQITEIILSTKNNSELRAKLPELIKIWENISKL